MFEFIEVHDVNYQNRKVVKSVTSNKKNNAKKKNQAPFFSTLVAINGRKLKKRSKLHSTHVANH
jgi:uncharacterized protein YoxC